LFQRHLTNVIKQKKKLKKKKEEVKARCRWLIPVILATQEAEIRSITVGNQPGQIVCETLSAHVDSCWC
jgi:hypothetical protein